MHRSFGSSVGTDEVVHGPSVSEVDMLDEAELGQSLERSVDTGPVDRRVLGCDVFGQVFCRWVQIEFHQRLDDRPPRRRQPSSRCLHTTQNCFHRFRAHAGNLPAENDECLGGQHRRSRSTLSLLRLGLPLGGYCRLMLTGSGASITIGRIAGAPVRVGPGSILVAAYIAFTLGSGWQGDASSFAVAAGAIATALGFMASIVAHEAGHTVAAKRAGISTSEIRLSLLGGVAALEQGAPDPNTEMKVAAAGPGTNLVIGALVLGGAFGLRSLGVDSTITMRALTWIGGVNIVLGLLNLVPGLPLDGGRVLTGFLWRRRQNRAAAVATTAKVGKVLGYAALAFAAYEFIVLQSVFGIYTAFIGWVLMRGADAELAHAQLSDRVMGRTVEEVTRFQPPMTEELTNTATARALLPSPQRERWAIVRDEDGVARGVADIAAISRAADLDGTDPVLGVMLPIDQSRAAFLHEPLDEVLRRGVIPPFVVIDPSWRPIGLVTSLDAPPMAMPTETPVGPEDR